MFLKKNGTNGTEKIFKDIIEENFPGIKEHLNMFLKKRYKTTNNEINELQGKGLYGHPEKSFLQQTGFILIVLTIQC